MGTEESYIDKFFINHPEISQHDLDNVQCFFGNVQYFVESTNGSNDFDFDEEEFFNLLEANEI